MKTKMELWQEKNCKIVGTISQEIIKEYGLEEYENQEIVQSIDMYIHISKHIREFQSIDNCHNAVFNIEQIIKEPYFVYYEKERNSLLYFKEIDEFICVVVKLSLRKNKKSYVATLYPTNMIKVEKFREKALLEKYRYEGNNH